MSSSSSFVPLIILPLALFLVSLSAMSLFRSNNQFPVANRTIIITGASQGLGLAVAQKLAAKGANIVIVARDVSKLERALALIRSCASNPSTQKFLSLSYDLTNPDSSTQILSAVTAWNNNSPPDIVWCCAGTSHPSFFADASIQTLQAQMDTIYWSCAYMAHATLNIWKTPPTTKPTAQLLPRHFIFTSSVLAFFPVAGYTPYTPAKAAMRALADSLNQEIAVYNGARQRPGSASSAPAADIKIHIVFPMGILSPGLEQENSIKPELTALLEKDDIPQRPEEVALSAITSLERGQYMITTLFLGHLMKGCAMGASVRSGVLDLLWTFLGSIVVLFVTPDFMSKCRKWGKERGLHTGPKAAVS